MAGFAYNNAKNAITSHTLYELNCNYHLCASYKEDANPYSRLKSVDELANEFKKLMTVCERNLQHVQDLQKYYHDKLTKSRSYVPGDKV